MKFIYFLTPMVVFSFYVSANTTLKNFTPGIYELSDGPAEDCGDGEFEIDQENKTVRLTALHLFSLDPKIEKLPGDTPGDEKCTYEAEDSKNVKAKETILTFSETRRCHKIEKHRLFKKATISKGLVKMESRQTGENSHSFTCIWKIIPGAK